MSTERWKRADDLFHAALEVESTRRSEFLEDQCGDDPAVLEEVKSLLAAHQDAENFIATVDATRILEEAYDPLSAGETIGVYKVIKEIGHGGMGAVYLAARADETFKKHVAIKVLKRGMDTQEILRHFRNERQILAGFDHPNIARLLDGGTTQSGLPYFVMEYVQGLPIDQYCDQHLLPITQRLELFRQVCAAVSYAHRHLVIHRDIKPTNILVTPEGEPKLLDFGVAKILDTNLDAGSTATGVRLMTPEYASPEQVMGFPVTTVSDVYSLGIVLYELLTGHAPYRFETRSPLEVARLIHASEPLSPSTVIGSLVEVNTPEAISKTRNTTRDQLKRRLRGDLDNIALMALRKEPQRRYQSVEQFSEDIRKHLEGLPVLARKDTLVYRVSKFAKRNTIGVVAAALILITLIAGVVATTWQAQIAKGEQARAEYAREFGDELRYIESLLLSTYTAPLHDSRQNLNMARNRLKRMEQRTVEGGRWAFGSGHNALGIGYLTLKDFERAKLHLEKAWNSGYQESSTAYALGKVFGILYQQKLTDADHLSNREIKQQVMNEAEKKYAKPAIEYLARARTHAESPAYVEGLIALYQKRFQEALQKTATAIQSSSRPYEVDKLEGDIHFAMGREAARRDYPAASKSFTLAGKAYARAADSARSDQDIYIADAYRLIRLLAGESRDATDVAKHALEQCDKAILINRDNDRGYLVKSDVLFQRGINQMYWSPNDPSAVFRMSIATAGEAIKRKKSAAAYDLEGEAYLRMGEYKTAMSLDPRDALNRAVAASQKALQVDRHYASAYLTAAGAYFYIGEYQLLRGQDPTDPLKKVIDIYDKDLRFLTKNEYALNILALTHVGLAEYKLKQGIDSTADLEKAIANSQLGLKINPQANQFFDTLGLAYVDMAKNDINHGKDPNKNFDHAIHYYNLALGRGAEGGYARFNRSSVYFARAEFKLRTGEDPETDINNAMTDLKKQLQATPDLLLTVLQIGTTHLLQARDQFANERDPTAEISRAAAQIANYLKQDQLNPLAYLNQGRLEFLSARWAVKNRRPPDAFLERAIAALEKCIELDKYQIEAYVEFASVCRRQAEWLMQTSKAAAKSIEQGLQRISEAEKINPNNAEIQALRATLLGLKSRETKDPGLAKESKELLQRALERNRFLRLEYQN